MRSMSHRNKARQHGKGVAIVLSLAVAVFPFGQSIGHVRAQSTADSASSTAEINDSQGRSRELTINALSATMARGGVVLQWRTTFELDNLGFDIYRVRNGQRTRANRSLILGSIFNVGAGVTLRGGYSYSWFDSAGTSDAIYYVESIAADGARRLHETSTAVSSGKLPESVESAVNSNSAGDRSQLLSEYPATLTPGGLSTLQGTIENQWAIAGQSALKIQIKMDGWYRVTQQQMVTAGFNPIVDIRNLSLYVNAQEIAIRTSKSSGQFGNGDYLEFYGQGLDTKESDTRIYYLIAGATPGKRTASDAPWSSFGLTDVSQARDSRVPFEAKANLTNQGLLFLPSVDFLHSPTTAARKEQTESKSGIALSGAPAEEPIADLIGINSTTLPPAFTSTPGEAEAKTVAPVEGRPVPPPAASVAKATPRRITRASGKKRRRKSGPKRSAAMRRYAHAFDQSAASVLSFAYTVGITERANYLFTLLNGDGQNYFGQPVYSFGTATDTLAIHNIQTAADGPAVLEVAAQGISLTNHVVSVFFNSVLLGTITTYFGHGEGVQRFNIPISQLLEGNNTVTMTVGAGDVSLVDYVRLTYPHSYTADSNTLLFTAREAQTLKVEGFSTASVLLLDISDPSNVRTTSPVSEPSGPGYAITVPPAPRKKARQPAFRAPERQPLRTLYALPEGQFLQPAGLTLNQPSTLNQFNNGADIVIISYKDFIPSLSKQMSPINQSYVGQRLSRDGLTSQIVDVEDIYDEFGYGAHTVQALFAFLSRASATWTLKKPRYVLLLGDASYDPRNYEGFGNWDLVPTKHVDTFYEDTCTDELLADFNGDGISELAIGRLPARTVAEADLMLSKTVNFSKANVPQTALLVADAQDGYYFNFADSNVAVANRLPQPQITVQFVNRGENHTPATDAATRTTIINNFNQGVSLANYSGHGNVDTWTGASIFTAPDARALNNGNKLTFVVVADCLNGLFDDRSLEGIGEAFVKAPLGGAVATFSSSGKTVPEGQHAMAQSLYQLIYGSQSIALGDAIKQAKTATTDMDVRHTWIFLGDPTLKIW